MSTRPRVFITNEETATYSPEVPAEYRDELPLLGATPEVEVAEAYATVNIRLPQYLFDEYRRVAAAQELSVEEVIQHRLEACRTHNALRGLWFSDTERGQLENLIQKWPLESAHQALTLISRAATVRFDDIEVVLSPAQKRVLALRTGNKKPETFFASLIKKEFQV
jgi:hypothetical protein